MPVLISEGIFVFLFPLKPVHDLFHTMERRLRSRFIREATGATSSRTNTAGLCHFSPLEMQSPRYYLEVGTDRCSTNFSVPDRQSSRIISWKNRALAAPSSAPFSVKHEKKKKEREKPMTLHACDYPTQIRAVSQNGISRRRLQL